MNYSVIFNKDLPPETKDHYVPLEWPMYLSALKNGEYPAAGMAKLTLDELNDLKNKLWPEYEIMQKNKQTYLATRKLRVMDLVAFEFKTYSPAKIDFTSHLKSGFNLEKRDVFMTKNGRPIQVIYYFQDVKIAELTYAFEVDPLNFMTRRTVSLGYYAIDDVVHDRYIIEDMHFNGTIPYQHQKQLEERTQGRQFIIDSLRADIDRMLTAAITQNPTASGYLSAMINAFWVEYNPHLSAFINAGGTYLRSKFQNDSTYPFLNSKVAVGVTVRMYIVNKLTY